MQAKGSIQRKSQNYPRMYGALFSNEYWKIGWIQGRLLDGVNLLNNPEPS